ncbi:MAG: insulinase family protein [Candidatus Colwellbacteria bacterium]|nr:insulinase family protein [Candidatus Colwellbacteria bacterium]MBI3273682.1 insulinase family protein [Candidatus Colwellbacteria bacterium]
MSFKKITLENGLRLITVPMKDSLTATVLVLVEAGSEYETKELNGLSHFLEHMCFKGTKKRPRTIDISGELDSIGSSYNAFTGGEMTGYYAKAESRHLDSILDIVSDIYLNPVFNPNEIEKEKGVIIEELNLHEDMPMRHVHDLFTQLVYGDQPAGWDVGGNIEVINKLRQEDFLKYREKHYIAPSSVVIVAGKFNEEKIKEKVEELFDKVHRARKPFKVKTEEYQNSPQILLKYKDSDQSHIVLGVRAFSIFDERHYALEVLADILGGGMSSRLFQKVREEMGAAYYVNAEAELSLDHGYLAAAAGLNHGKLPQALEAIIKEFKRLKEIPVSKEELQRAKDHLVGSLMVGLETSDDLARFYGVQEILTANALTPRELETKLRAVTANEIINLAREAFQNNKLNLAVIGPLKDEAVLRKLLELD